MAGRTEQVEIIVFKKINDEIIFLLLKRADQRGGFWQPITGGVEEGENLAEAVSRELQEETGITEYLQIINEVNYFEFDASEHGHLKEYVFGVEVSPQTKIKLSPEHTEMNWCNLEEALSLLKYENNKNGFENLFSLLSAKN